MSIGSIIFSGCSITSGQGLNQNNPNIDYKESENLWVNLCHRNIDCFKQLQLVNVAQAGISNTDIFENALYEISKTPNIKFMICAWTSMPRYTFNVGFELYDSQAGINFKNRDHLLNNKTISGKYIQDISDRFRALHHYQWEISRVIKYVNILEGLAKRLKFQILHINALCPWDQDFFKFKINCRPSDLTEFTKNQILYVDNRDDDEIFSLYQKQHSMYESLGGIHEEKWINLYESFRSLRVDLAFDNSHPGVKSNEVYFNLVKDFMEKSATVTA